MLVLGTDVTDGREFGWEGHYLLHLLRCSKRAEKGYSTVGLACLGRWTGGLTPLSYCVLYNRKERGIWCVWAVFRFMHAWHGMAWSGRVRTMSGLRARPPPPFLPCIETHLVLLGALDVTLRGRSSAGSAISRCMRLVYIYCPEYAVGTQRTTTFPKDQRAGCTSPSSPAINPGQDTHTQRTANRPTFGGDSLPSVPPLQRTPLGRKRHPLFPFRFLPQQPDGTPRAH